MEDTCKSNLVRWGLVGDEKKETRRRLITRSMKKYGLSKEDAEEAVDIWINAVNETAREFGEDV